MLNLVKASAGIEFEKEHGQLLALSDRTCRLLRAGAIAAAVLRFESILDLARRHFAAEERLMRRTRYPRAEEHARAHGRMLDEITRLLLELRCDDPEAPAQAQRFLASWRRDHIDTIDQDFSDFLRNGSHPKQDPSLRSG
jgi:hemerythrin